MTRLRPVPSQCGSRKLTESSLGGKENREMTVNMKESSVVESKSSVVVECGEENEALRRRLAKQ